MKRSLLLGTIVCAGLIVMGLGLSAQQPARGGAGGQGRGGGGLGPIGTIQKMADTLYMIPGAGGNTAVFITANGVVLVDTKLADNGQAILNQVKTVTNKAVTHIINTHTHGDHTGSNDFFPASVEIIVQENTAANMAKMAYFKDPARKHGLPDKTYKDKMTVLSGKDAIDLYYYGAAHTNGDAWVVFRGLRTMHAGDAFAAKGTPLIDANNGGSGMAFPQTLDRAVAGIKNVDTVITGHSTIMKWADLKDFADFNRMFLDAARAARKAGKTPEQAAAEFKLPEKFKDYNVGRAATNFTLIFGELKK
ncbi:MAG TPA: MBL fold metallo-hydrolase [Terriglobia bacterium]|nr:MBL fold metallo-hydrolase [Terriglobia bacterium]